MDEFFHYFGYKRMGHHHLHSCIFLLYIHTFWLEMSHLKCNIIRTDMGEGRVGPIRKISGGKQIFFSIKEMVILHIFQYHLHLLHHHQLPLKLQLLLRFHQFIDTPITIPLSQLPTE